METARHAMAAASEIDASQEVIMHLARRLAAIAALATVLFLGFASSAWAERQCDVPAGYYRIVNLEGTLPVELHAAASEDADVLERVHVGDIVQSDGIRDVSGGMTWQHVKIIQTEGWILARHLWRTLPLSLDRAVLPEAGWCGSYDPSWGLLWTGHELQMSAYPEKYQVRLRPAQSVAGTGVALLAGTAPGVSFTIIYKDEICRDQAGVMNGLGSVYVLIDSGGRRQLYSGCCSAAASAFAKRAVPGME